MLIPQPTSTDIEIGDVLRFNGLAHKGFERTVHRTPVWFTVHSLSYTGRVALSPVNGGGLIDLPISDLAEMLEQDIYQVVAEVGK